MMDGKTPKKITIEVSVATHARLCGLEEKVAEILRIPASRVSHEQIILIAISQKSLDEALVDLALQA